MCMCVLMRVSSMQVDGLRFGLGLSSVLFGQGADMLRVMLPSLTLNFCSSCFYLLSAWILDVHHQAKVEIFILLCFLMLIGWLVVRNRDLGFCSCIVIVAMVVLHVPSPSF